MSRGKPTLVFPGQGTLCGSSFRSGPLRAEFEFVLARIGASEIDSTEADVARRLVQVLLDQAPATPAAVSLFVFAASVAHHFALENWGVRPAVMVGHAFGEIAALVCGGALSLERGAEIVVHRTAVLNGCPSAAGRMLVARTSVTRAERLVERAGVERVAVAAENSSTEVVISGSVRGIDAVRRLAFREGIEVSPLRSPWALHQPRLMLPAAAELAKRLRGIPWKAPQVRVFSPILGRYYSPFDKLPECLAAQLAQRVRFADAVRQLCNSGMGPFIECGPLAGLGRCLETEPAAFRPRPMPFCAEDGTDLGAERSASVLGLHASYAPPYWDPLPAGLTELVRVQEHSDDASSL